ncbi:25.3 kDa vesicle transport protein [Diplonema papillatum]|nr:25.3 kDa vesicle transport protein [Diplonema papillatum]
MNSTIINTSIYRLGDGLLLCSHGSSGGVSDHESTVFRHVQQQYHAGSLARHTFLEGAEASFFILNDNNVCYICCSPRGNSREAVHAFLEDVRREFHDMFSLHEINAASRQYQLINFDKVIMRISRRFDGAGHNPKVLALQKELTEVTSIMKQSLEDVLGRGEKLDNLYNQSNKLKSESANYSKKTKQLTRMAFLRKAAVPAAITLSALMLISWKLGFGLLFFF